MTDDEIRIAKLRIEAKLWLCKLTRNPAYLSTPAEVQRVERNDFYRRMAQKLSK